VIASLSVAVLLLTDVPGRKLSLDLTPKEQVWLEEHADSIRLAPLPDSPPIDFTDKGGNHLGLTADYIRLIEGRLGIRFQKVECESWKEIIEKLRKHEIDMVGSIQNTVERQKFLHFTAPYLTIQNVILTRTEWNESFTLDNMAGMEIAVVEGSATYDYVRSVRPKYRLIPVKDATTGFRMVSFGEADAMIADLGVASYYIEELGISNLRVAGDIDYPWELCLASRSDWPELSSILDKTLDSITTEQRRQIRRDWITLSDRVHITRDRYLRITGIILILTLLAIGSVMFWNQTLRRQISRHSTELGEVKQSHAQTEQALGESEERFRALVESSGDMIWEMDPYGSYLYVSPRVEEILGYKPDELINKSSMSLMAPQDSALKMEEIRKCTAASVIDREINTFVRNDGREVILESSGMAYADNTGELAGFRGVSRDITERLENEKALRQSEERFRNLVETTSDWIWEVNTAGDYTYTSPQVGELLGYTPAELMDKRFTDLMPAAESETVRRLFAEMVEQGAPIHSLVTTNRHKDGRTVVLETSAVPYYDSNWNIQGYRGIGRDITDRVAAEKQLEFERSLFRTFMEHAPDLIYFKDREGHYIEANASLAQEVHLTPDEMVGRTDFDLYPEEQAKQRYDDEQEVMRTRQPIKREEMATTPDGDQWYVSTKVPRFDEAGEVIGTFGTSWNITHRKLAEEQLRQLRALLSNTIDSMPSILIGVDAHGDIIQWNRQAEHETGLPPNEALGKSLHDIYPALSSEMVKVERAIRERRTQIEERKAVQEDERVRYNDITVYPLLEGESEGAVIRVDDVTERVQLEESIRNIVEGVASVGRRFFDSMVNQLVKTLGADYTFISEYCDDSTDSMRTIAVSDKGESGANFEFALANTPYEMVVQSDDCIYIDNAREKYPDAELLQELEIEGYIGIPLMDSENKVRGIMVALYREPVEQVEFATSIIQVFAGRTAAELERLQATKELVALRNLLENIINSMPSILVGIDADGCVMQWNREAERLTGTESIHAHGRPFAEVFPDFGGEMNALLDSLGSRDSQRHERIHCAIRGDQRIVDVTVYPITGDGSEGAVVRLDDVTDRVRIEDMMVQSEKMMSVGGLAAGMAHEINNPLAGILQNLQVMRNRITHATERNTDAAREVGTTLESVQAYMEARGLLTMMDSITEAGRRAAKIVDNMLSFSRKDEAHFAANSIAEIIERSIELASNDYNLKKRFDFRHIRINREIEPMDPIPCEGSQIQQVLLNLLSNSAQAMADRDEDTRDPEITVRLKKVGGMAQIEVEDNGPGMDADTRKRVFEPFFTTKEVGRGTGLGLSVSYFIITENHGGTMNVTSSPGHGAKFTIRIPFEHRMARWGLRI
jgi:PAS domain S-box-containing protein